MATKQGVLTEHGRIVGASKPVDYGSDAVWKQAERAARKVGYERCANCGGWGRVEKMVKVGKEHFCPNHVPEGCYD